MLKKTKLWAPALILCSISAMRASAQDQSAFPPATGGQSISIPSTSMKFEDRGNRGATGKITLVDVYGDGRTGRHGTIMKFTPGFLSHVHTHSYDYYGVVIKGEMENYEVGVTPIKMGPGSYWYQKGLQQHITACLSKEPCLAFVVQSQKFDVQHPDAKK